LAGKHEHAHILPLDLDGDDHLDHFLIWAAMGLDAVAQAAIRAVRRTFTKGGIGPLRLALAGTGSLADFGNSPGVYGSALQVLQGGPAGAKEWISLTPFVAPRHLKQRGTHSLEGQVCAELAARGLPAPGAIRIIDPRGEGKTGNRALCHRHFVRSRRNGPTPPVDCGFTMLLHFEVPIHPARPLALGYGCHFGLGLFVADSDRS
jgi:CRISPR-associated protein Csb2